MEQLKQFREADGGLVVLAPCKINLSLLIGRKRCDGFHELETIMAKVGWYDELLFEKRDQEGIELICRGEHWAPEGPENLVWRAYDMVMEAVCDSKKFGAGRGVRVTLTKNIPAGSGLGSASSDAAAALSGLNRFLESGLSEEKLYDMAGRLGSDVAFFLGGPLAFCWGRGEKIKEIQEKFSFRALLVLPGVSSSTKRVYENFKPDIEVFDQLRAEINSHILKKNIAFAARMCANMLDESCFALYPRVKEVKQYVESLAIGYVCLSGSGSTVYCLLGDVRDEYVKHYQLQLKEKFNCESLVVYNNRW